MNKDSVFVSLLKYYNLYQPEQKYKIVCPFHGDINASMQINLDKEYFYCYGCQRSGSSFELVKEFNQNLSSIQIYSLIKKITNLSIQPSKGKGDIGGRVNKITNIKQSKDFYYNLPKTNWYKPDEEVYFVKRYLVNRGFTSKLLIQSGAKATYKSNYPVIFPLFDNLCFKGYVMRTTDKIIEQERKYMYNKGFIRSNTLSGTYKRKQPVVIVEGHLDMLKGKQIGIKNIVAILGWKISSNQIEKLKQKEITDIICALDNDESGNKGYKYLKRIAFVNNFKIHRIRFPKGIKDFGDINKNTKEAEIILNQLKKFNFLL